ncbi:MAG TPA: flavodoxin [Firmicutes bacterium]|nr:flavodoxin [Bacillota bacterium]
MKHRALIVYYSHSGNTEQIAHCIQEKTRGDLLKIEPQVAYPTDYHTVVEQAKKEINQGYHPALATKLPDLTDYDTVFVGSPNWWSTIAPPIASFLTEANLNGKNIVPFCTHGGGGFAHLERDMKKLCPDSNMVKGIAISGSGGKNISSTIDSWLKSIGMED